MDEPQKDPYTPHNTDGSLLLAEIDRLRVRCRQFDDEAYDYAQQIERQKEEMDRLYAAAKQSADRYAEALAENDRLRDDLQKQTETVQYLIGERTADREHWEQIETRLDHAEAIIDRVRVLHGEGFTRGCCKTCKGYDSFDVPLPCPTLRALDGDVSSPLYRAEGRSMSNAAKNEWQRVAQRLGEFFLSVRSDLYYNFPPHIWLDWALNQIEGLRGRAERAERNIGAFLSGFERRGLLPEGSEPLSGEVIEAVAQVFERVERAERILDALREPSDATVDALAAAAWSADCALVSREGGPAMLRAAVAAAEREVDA